MCTLVFIYKSNKLDISAVQCSLYGLSMMCVCVCYSSRDGERPIMLYCVNSVVMT